MKIALCGRIQSGKSTVAKHLSDKKGFYVIDLNAKIDRICSQHQNTIWSFLPTVKQLFPDADKETLIVIQKDLCDLFKKIAPAKKNYRLQIEVDSLLRKYNEDVWIDFINREANDHENVVVDSIRTRHELDKLRNNGYSIINVVTTEEIQRKRFRNSIGVVDDLLLVSEQQLEGCSFDYIVNSNDADFDSVCGRLETILEELNVKES